MKSRLELVSLLKELKLPLIVAEVGVAEGRFSLDFLKAGVEKLYLIDAWETLNQKGDGGFGKEWHDDNYNGMLSRIDPFKRKVNILRGLSYEMSEEIKDNELSMVYIDADHSYDGVKRDLNAFYSKVKSGGIIAGHDYTNSDYGVFQAVAEFCKEKNYTPILIPENGNDSSFYFIKR
jgi:hypothetical protein